MCNKNKSREHESTTANSDIALHFIQCNSSSSLCATAGANNNNNNNTTIIMVTNRIAVEVVAATEKKIYAHLVLSLSVFFFPYALFILSKSSFRA